MARRPRLRRGRSCSASPRVGKPPKRSPERWPLCGRGCGASRRGGRRCWTHAVAAGAGAAVAKHGNRSISSRVGSADVLSACGVPIDLDPSAAGRVLDEVGLVFLFAPAFHPAMKELGTVRRELGIRTIFNALGPLANPAGASRQLIGVGRPELVRLLADALASLGAERAIVFHVANGLDELVPGVPAAGVEVRDGWTRPWTFDPTVLRQRPVGLTELAGGDAAQNAGMLERLLDGEDGARRETVLANVAVALTLEGSAANVAEGYERPAPRSTAAG